MIQNKEQLIELNLLLAMFRCFNEQLYNLKGAHSGLIKRKFNHLVKVGRQYEKEVLKATGHAQELENVYDAMMELMITLKKEIYGQD
jgi:hypothetical protein